MNPINGKSPFIQIFNEKQSNNVKSTHKPVSEEEKEKLKIQLEKFMNLSMEINKIKKNTQ